MNFEEVNKSLWNDKCDYINPEKVNNLNLGGLNLIMLQLNIRSILSHATELKQLVHTLESKKSCVDKNVYPTITRPTRICHNTVTLTDNIFVSVRLHKYFESAIILEDISDHLPTLALLKQTKLVDDKPIEFESRKLNPERIKVMKQKLLLVD